jgi:diaminopimelate decarboxylase
MSSIILPPSLVLPFSQDQIEKAIQVNGWITPFHLYSEKVMTNTSQNLAKAFANVGLPFKNHYAVKALPNPKVLQILKDQGMGMDCSSVTELMLADRIGVSGEDIMFTSNNTTLEEFKEAKNRWAIINLDDITHIETLKKLWTLPDIICCRYNPGTDKEWTSIIGNPIEAKYGMRKDQIIEAYRQLKEGWVDRFGLHAMLVSNEKNEDKVIENARILFDLAKEIKAAAGVEFEWINLGWGIGASYRPTDTDVDLAIIARGIKDLYNKTIIANGLGTPKIYMENGRYITGPAGALITRVLNVANKHINFVGVDGSMANLMRPGMYTTKNPDGTWDECYHHISVIGKENIPYDKVYNVTGSLCENNDQFARWRTLPKIEQGDLIAIHTTGAHGQSMAFQYNGKLRGAELLGKINWDIQLIRRAETPEDYFATLV